ncbi:MAG: D-alanyl-D-alanine carboxypeptidase [Ruminococcaceae bacterium]|nr:D-alanyl-D-alanine carboxypeptidase [Oscillospiraceae bacterium]
MFIYQILPLRLKRRLSLFFFATAVITAIAVCISSSIMVLHGAQASFASSAAWTSCMSGDVCIPRGDGISAAALTGVSAKGAVLLEAETGTVIFGHQQNLRLPMASTTKIMTALVALEQLPSDTPVTITADAVGIEGSSIYLTEGETLTMEQLLYALLLESANDAAVAIAIAVAGGVDEFAELMNRRARDLDLTQTHFTNPHGLDNEEHYTTALELAKITQAALANPTFRRICSTRRHTIPLNGSEGTRVLVNHNKLLAAYPGCIGVKTGFTKKTGRCLVSAAERDGVTLIAVTLNAPDDWRDHAAMLDYGFGIYESVQLCKEGFFSAPLPIISGTREYVMVENFSDRSMTLRRDHGPIACVAELPRFAFAPIAGKQAVGRLVFYEICPDGTRIRLCEVSLHATYGTDEIQYKKGLMDWLLSLRK